MKKNGDYKEKKNQLFLNTSEQKKSLNRRVKIIEACLFSILFLFLPPLKAGFYDWPILGIGIAVMVIFFNFESYTRETVPANKVEELLHEIWSLEKEKTHE
jgi:hypothetical protein